MHDETQQQDVKNTQSHTHTHTQIRLLHRNFTTKSLLLSNTTLYTNKNGEKGYTLGEPSTLERQSAHNRKPENMVTVGTRTKRFSDSPSVQHSQHMQHRGRFDSVPTHKDCSTRDSSRTWGTGKSGHVFPWKVYHFTAIRLSPRHYLGRNVIPVTRVSQIPPTNNDQSWHPESKNTPDSRQMHGKTFATRFSWVFFLFLKILTTKIISLFHLFQERAELFEELKLELLGLFPHHLLQEPNGLLRQHLPNPATGTWISGQRRGEGIWYDGISFVPAAGKTYGKKYKQINKHFFNAKTSFKTKKKWQLSQRPLFAFKIATCRPNNVL